MRLELEDLESDLAVNEADAELPIVADTDKVRGLPVRKLNPNLPRKRIVRGPSCACCPGCGGALRAMGQDREEMLDLVAQGLAGHGDPFDPSTAGGSAIRGRLETRPQ
ncbi:hypothetical protein [Mesorhizobium sp. J8]|uniref:hypothetical protein n=1 Tax=Mesorhizobium sp. J8 TaxID=2777475 RepID=UPI001914DDE4|nr:hypothetical protein [Mesorhizobium sp. J8]